jgi:hypothetical protein
MSHDADRDLVQRFSELRAADKRGAPSFASVMARQQTTTRRPLWPAFAGSLALVAVVAVWRLTSTSERFEFHAGEMRVPTDYLLELVTVPRAGEIPKVGVIDWYPLESSTQERRTQ